jgi:hypothetical protein
MGLTMSQDSLTSRTSPETAVTPACQESITQVTIHGTPQSGMLGMPNGHDGHATLTLQQDKSHMRCSGASLQSEWSTRPIVAHRIPQVDNKSHSQTPSNLQGTERTSRMQKRVKSLTGAALNRIQAPETSSQGNLDLDKLCGGGS